ncbi:hypothetical protein ACE02Z_00325 [Shewanella xiamenensis]|uniref:hypothetical protein n=1 Tax=Shewanella xiamenensis TaxID=332186 RepID=UPI00313C8E3D
MKLFNIISTEERQKIEAAYNKTAECQARYQRCLAVINTNEQFNNGKTRTRQWLEAITDTAERERCRTVLNKIIAAKRLYAKKD